MILLAAVTNIITISVAPPALANEFAIFYRVIATALGSRLILNLRGSILCPSHTERPTIIELDTLAFGGQEIYQSTTQDLVENAENPEGVA